MDSPTRDGGLLAGDIAITLVIATVCIVTVAANIVVISTICFTRKLYSVSSALVVNTAVCDLGIGVAALPLFLSGILHGHWPYSQAVCSLTAVLVNILCINSVWSVAAIALDRFLEITYCLHYSSWSPWRYGAGLIVAIWLISLTFGLSPLASWGGVAVQDISYVCVVTWTHNLSYGISVLLLCFMLPFATMCFCYINIIKVARRHARRVGDVNVQAESSRTNVNPTGAVAAGAMFSVRRLSMLSFPGNTDGKANVTNVYFDDYASTSSTTNAVSPLRRDVRTTLRLLGFIFVCIFCWIFTICVNMKHAVTDSHSSPYFTGIAYCLSLLNSFFNPFLYAISRKPFRHATRRLIQCKRSTSIDVRATNNDPRTSYVGYLRNLRTPSVTLDLPEFQPTHARSPETSSTFADSRPSSGISLNSARRQFLNVPRQSVPDTINFLLPNAVSEVDQACASSHPGHNKFHKGKLPSEQVDCYRSNTGIEEYVYDIQNKANIQIKLDLV